MTASTGKSIGYGTLAGMVLLGAYFVILTAVSGWEFAQSQFADFWYFIVSLALGFGVQVVLYTYLKQTVGTESSAKGTVTVTGTTSGFAMISCCAHYAANLLPLLGTVGLVSFVAAYQTELFWVGIIFNLAGIALLSRRVLAVRHMHMHMHMQQT